jgi:tungstate transport system ATP-binding protein
MTTGEPLYTLQQIQQRYNGRVVLDLDTFTIPKGKIFALVGPSGAGKSTLLRLLNFLELPSSGRLQFEGESYDIAPPLATRRRITMVFQRPNLLRQSVAANLQFGLQLRGQKLSNQALNAWLKQVDLHLLARQPAATLSAGEAQRLALIRALAIRPQVLLLDEPTANLDPYNVGLIEALVRDENQKRGTTIVLVTHNVFQARRLAHHVAFLLNGRLVEVAPVSTFFDQPSDPRTAAFVNGELVW